MGWQDAPIVHGEQIRKGNSWQTAPIENQPAETQQEPYTGQFLPFSNTPEGGMTFDPNAGILGPFYRAVTLPMDALKGKVDPKSEEGIARSLEAATVTSPVSAGTRGGLGWAGVKPKTRYKPVETPAGKELLKEGDLDYKLARRLDVRYYPVAVKNWAMKQHQQLFKPGGYRNTEHSASETYTELEGLLKSRGDFVSIDDLQAVRLNLEAIAKNFNRPTDQKAAIQVLRGLDEFITRPDPESVMAGPAADAGDIWARATKNYGAGMRSNRLVDKRTSVEEKVEGKRHVLSSGSTDKSIRDRVGTFLTTPKEISGLSDAEIALLETVRDGTAPRNIVSIVGNWMSTGFATGLSLTAALSAVANPLALAGAIPGATVLGAKALGNTLTKRALNKAAEKVRQRSPLYEERAAAATPRQPVPPSISAVPLRGSGAAVPLVRNGRSYGPAPAQPQMTPEQWNEYLKQKYARDQGA